MNECAKLAAGFKALTARCSELESGIDAIMDDRAILVDELDNALDERDAARSDSVNHPSHYTSGGIECIKAIEASMTAEEFQGYCKGNCLKYLWRYRQKNGAEDIEKAAVYLGWLRESVAKQEASE